ncbi:MAG: ATP-binding cassette domain-containing protein [bacterium]|nr:ATP-binding cassette domain-containing protein [Gammaproteobacteria bacterium]HIL98651.1 ATP-binding cassette domain-containing protein [Pseudomonadales bacterium]
MLHSLEIDKVTKVFGDNVAVDKISANIPTGSIYGFLGPNGAGKTTTIRMIMSILYPDAGSIKLFGSLTPEQCKDRLGYLPEEKGLYKKMKTIELITYFGRLKGIPGSLARSKALQLLQQFGLGSCADLRCDALSKGMGQKVQIIATLLHEPELVILDEPFSGLDPINVEVVRDIILDLKRAGKTVIFSTHVMEQAEQICDYILLINNGKKILDGSLAEVKKCGHQTISLEYEGSGEVLRNLPGVTRVNDMGKAAELSLQPDADPQSILTRIVPELTLRSFTVNDPSLHEIFVRSVGDIDETVPQDHGPES